MKIILRNRREERIVDINDVEIFTADSKCVIATIGKDEWFVKDRQPGYIASLLSMSNHAGDKFVYLSRNKLVRKDLIVGRTLDFGLKGSVAAVLVGGQKIEVSRRRQAGFNRLILEMTR